MPCTGDTSAFANSSPPVLESEVLSRRASRIILLDHQSVAVTFRKVAGIDVPLVVRLDGTNAEEGRKILADAAHPGVHVEPTMLDAARKAVELAA